LQREGKRDFDSARRIIECLSMNIDVENVERFLRKSKK